MSFFKRLFSADYRRAVAAEAAGDYDEAARAYALAGERAKVAAMHLFRAERQNGPEARLAELRAAVRWADAEDADGREMRRRIARALLVWSRRVGVVSDADRVVTRDAAALFTEVGDHAGAAECWELLGEELQAAEAYQKAGELERLEAVLAREETRRKATQRVHDALDEYKLHLADGKRDAALASIKFCAENADDGERGEYRRLVEELERKRLSAGKVLLRAAGSEIVYVGKFPLVLGREATCEVALRDAGISRRHVEIDSNFVLHDLGSKNGTRLGGLALQSGAALPLVDAGELGIGEVCAASFAVKGAVLELRVTRGLDRGMTILASRAPFALGEAGELRFLDGKPAIAARAGGPLRLNGVVAGGAVQLLHGDTVEIAGQSWEVV